MPTYSYLCPDHGYYDRHKRMKDHARDVCPTCGSETSQVLLQPPVLDTEAMADIGMPGAFEKSGDRMTERHRKAGQDHHYWRNDLS
ncbi:MAG: hypothetical protein GTO49_17205 [Anaerolineae bacterium]|nr:hypothetical protein [Anaerolineae bacterium]